MGAFCYLKKDKMLIKKAESLSEKEFLFVKIFLKYKQFLLIIGHLC